MEQYIVIAKIPEGTGKHTDHRIVVVVSPLSIPAGYEQVSGPASLDDCVNYIKELSGSQTGWQALTYMQYGLIFIVTLAFVWVVYQGASKLQVIKPEDVGSLITTADDGARIFITFLVAVTTVAIAFLAILTAMVIREYKERFALAKEVLTILVGILGTIVGFYFGTAGNTKTPANNTENRGNGNPGGGNQGNSGGNSGNTGSTSVNRTPNVNVSPTATVRRVRLSSGREVLISYTADGRRKLFVQ